MRETLLSVNTRLQLLSRKRAVVIPHHKAFDMVDEIMSDIDDIVRTLQPAEPVASDPAPMPESTKDVQAAEMSAPAEPVSTTDAPKPPKAASPAGKTSKPKAKKTKNTSTKGAKSS